MAGICCGVVGDAESSSATVDPKSRGAAIRRMLEPMPFKLVADAAAAITPAIENGRKRRKMENHESSKVKLKSEESSDAAAVKKRRADLSSSDHQSVNLHEESAQQPSAKDSPKFGLTSVCGRRRDMEDAVSVQPWFCGGDSESNPTGLHLFGVFDGHGCSHVAMRCKQRLHEIVKEEIEHSTDTIRWKETMERGFTRMDKEVNLREDGAAPSHCRCELQTPQCDAVGSTAVVAVLTPDKIVVSNSGDSRAVLCRNGAPIPLSVDHKPDRPDELARIENAGGRVIYWDGARVLGVLAMSRAIGDDYLKPYVIPDPEVTVTERSEEDECLILASDGLWDVVSNETACSVARMCLRAQKPPSPPQSPGLNMTVSAGRESSDKACSDASILLTKLALARRSSDNVSVVVVDLRRGQ